VAYQAVAIDRKNALGRARVSLQQLHPRSRTVESIEVLTHSKLQLA
jgi:hypothetical protein